MLSLRNLPRLLAVAAAGASLSLAASAASAQSVEYRLGTGTPPSHVWTKAAERLAEQVGEKSGGEIKISVFPAAQLGPESDLLQQMQVGVLDMSIVSAAAASARGPAFLAWFSPFAFADVEEAIDASKGETAQEILETLKPQGIRGLGYVFAGMRHILTTNKAATTLDDLAQKKIRITPFPGMQVWWAAAGAVPTPVQLADVYQSLDSGLLDGVDIDLDALVGQSLQQVAKHLTVTNHMAFPGVVMINENSWGKMSAEQQEIFNTVLDETLSWASDLQIETEQRLLTQLEGEIEVVRLEDAKSVFSTANKAFDDAFEKIPEVAKFQSEIAQ